MNCITFDDDGGGGLVFIIEKIALQVLSAGRNKSLLLIEKRKRACFYY